jgi:hypothetical protein
MKKIVGLIAFVTFSPCLFALDVKYAPIVNAALADLKAHTTLSLLQGHVAINVSSGNSELDAQFGETLQSAYSNFASKTDAVNREDLYQMTVTVYRENSDVVVRIIVTDFKQNNIVERTVKVKKVSPAVMETLQYKTAIAAKNEFEAYLDSAFANAGGVAQEARVKPKPPKEPVKIPDWIAPDMALEFDLLNFNPVVTGGIGFSPDALSVMSILFNFYGDIQIGLKENAEGIRFDAGYLLRYNEHFYIPIGFGTSTRSIYSDNPPQSTAETGFAFSTGIMTVWTFSGFGFYAGVKFNFGTDTKNYLNNALEIHGGFIWRWKEVMKDYFR